MSLRKKKVTLTVLTKGSNETKQKIETKQLTSGGFHRQYNILRFIKCRQAVIGDFQDPSCVYYAIPRREIAVSTYRSAMKVPHTLNRIITKPFKNYHICSVYRGISGTRNRL